MRWNAGSRCEAMRRAKARSQPQEASPRARLVGWASPGLYRRRAKLHEKIGERRDARVEARSCEIRLEAFGERS